MIDLLHALGRFAAHATNATRPWLPLSDAGIDGAAMGALMAHGLAERDADKAIYRLTSKGRAETEGLEGSARFSLDALLGSARRTAQPGAGRDQIARTAVLLTCDDDLRSALRAALCEVLAGEEGDLDRKAGAIRQAGGGRAGEAGDALAGFELNQRPRAAAAGGSGGSGATSPASGPSRWAQAGDALRSEAVVVTTGPSTTKVLAHCTADDLRAASTYYAGVAVESARRSRTYDALVEALELYEVETVADLERVAPDRLKELLP